MITTVKTTPYSDQKMGTAGLRRKSKVVIQENYIENFVQSIFNVIDNLSEKTLFDILDKKIPSSPYMFIFSILYYILKIEKYGDTIDIDDSQISQLNYNTTCIFDITCYCWIIFTYCMYFTTVIIIFHIR